MAFADPRYLILLAVLLPAAALALSIAERRRRAGLERFGESRLLGLSSALPEPGRRAARQALALAGLALVFVALARPQLGEKPLVLTRTGRDVLFVLDLSRSMNAEDLVPSRLAAAKRAIREILDASPGDRVGLELFGGSAFLQVPLTLDRAAFDLFLTAASTDDISDPGTDLPEALYAAAEAFDETSEPRYRVIVLLSDGENLEGDPSQAVERLEKSGVRAFTVGVGTREGAPIPIRAGRRLLGYHRDSAGTVVITRLDEEPLRRLADETGGTYAHLGRAGGVRGLAHELADLEKREISSRSFTRLADRYQWPLALAFAALLGEGLLRDRRRGRLRPQRGLASGCVAALVLGTLGVRELPAQTLTEGERLYRQGRFQEAYEAFRRAAGDGRESPALDYDTGNALYRLGRYPDAATSYGEALAGPPQVRQRSYYNMGNAFFKASEGAGDERRAALARAVAAYERALKLDSRDRAAKWNLELALRRLREAEEQRRREEPGGDGSGDGDPRDDQANRAPNDDRGRGGGEGRRGENRNRQPSGVGERPRNGETEATRGLTEEEARRLLEAIQSEEGEALEHLDERRVRGSSGERDW